MAVCKYHRVNIEHLAPTALYPIIMLRADHASTRRTLQTCYFVNMFICNVNKYILYYYDYYYYYLSFKFNVLSFYFEFLTTDCESEPDHIIQVIKITFIYLYYVHKKQ